MRQSWDPNPASLTPKSMFLNHHRMPLLQNISKEKGERNEKSTKYLSHALPYLEPLPPSGVTSLDSGPRDGPSEAGGEDRGLGEGPLFSGTSYNGATRRGAASRGGPRMASETWAERKSRHTGSLDTAPDQGNTQDTHQLSSSPPRRWHRRGLTTWKEAPAVKMTSGDANGITQDLRP